MPKIIQKLHFKCNTITLQQPKPQPGLAQISTAHTLVFSSPRHSADSPLCICVWPIHIYKDWETHYGIVWHWEANGTNLQGVPSVHSWEHPHCSVPVRSERWVCSGPDHLLWTQMYLDPQLPLPPTSSETLTRTWAEFWTSLCLRFLPCLMGMMAPILHRCWQDDRKPNKI